MCWLPIAPFLKHLEHLNSFRFQDFPALNNSTDALVLRNNEGLLIDSLTYTTDWGGDEVTLERRQVDVSGEFQANWGDSPSPEFGTPGKQNEIGQDKEAPFVINLSVISNTKVRLVFSEIPVRSSVENNANYSTDTGLIITQISATQDTATLTFEAQFTDGQEFELTIQNVEDIFGNILSSQTLAIQYVEVSQALKQQVVVNEILYLRKDELSPEFVELYNLTTKNFDLSGWELIDAGSNDANIPEGTFLFAGEYLVLADREDFAALLENGVYLSDFPSLNNSGDELVLKNAAGITIDSLFYESLWGGDTPGVSLERKDPLSSSNDPSNWGSSTAVTGFSAGISSSIFEDDVTPPEIVFFHSD